MRKSCMMIAALAVLCSACAGSKPQPESDKTYTYEIIAEDSYDSNHRTPGYTVSETAEDHILVTIFSGEHGSGGYSLEVISVKETGGILTITVRETGPGPDDIVTTALTYPCITVSVSPVPETIRIADETGAEYDRLPQN